MSHTCHAIGCDLPVPPVMLMCKKHWGMVPRVTQLMIWAEYRNGQEIDKRPSRAYLIVQRAACAQVAQLENDRQGAARAWLEFSALMNAPGKIEFKDHALSRSFLRSLKTQWEAR